MICCVVGGKGSPGHPRFLRLQLALMPDKLCLSSGDSLGKKITSHAVSLAVNLINLGSSTAAEHIKATDC